MYEDIKFLNIGTSSTQFISNVITETFVRVLKNISLFLQLNGQTKTHIKANIGLKKICYLEIGLEILVYGNTTEKRLCFGLGSDYHH